MKQVRITREQLPTVSDLLAGAKRGVERFRHWFFTRDERKVGLQPFELVKYFSFASLIGIFLASIILSWAISNNAKKVLLARSDAYSRVFAKHMNQQVFRQFVLPTVVRYGRIALSNEMQFDRLDTIVRNLIRDMQIQSVTIYDSRENIISYSTREEMVGKRDLGGLEYHRALEGQVSSILDSSGAMFSVVPGGSEVTSMLKTYIPFRGGQSDIVRSEGNIMGVIEVVKDLSGDMQAISDLRSRIIILSFSVMGVLFALLSVIVIRANRVIERRVRENIAPLQFFAITAWLLPIS
jgi:hypothetical protein